MKVVEVKKWKSKAVNEKKEVVEIDETTLNALTVLVNSKKPEEMPKGLDNFRIMSRISKAFDEAEKANELYLEDADYKFLKDIIEKDIPSNWGRNHDIVEAIDAFLNPTQK